MIKLDRVVIVEGRYDKIKLSAILDAVIIETEGYGIFKNKEQQLLIRMLAKRKGLIVLTDSDAAGFKIRNFISSIVDKGTVINAYIPDIFGKEKRKTEYSKEGKLGVEGVDEEIIIKALSDSGVLCEKCEKSVQREITLNDFYEYGLTGKTDSAQKRNHIKKQYDLPERLSTKALLQVINCITDYDEFIQRCVLCE